MLGLTIFQLRSQNLRRFALRMLTLQPTHATFTGRFRFGGEPLAFGRSSLEVTLP
jgi:hypothetical protein